jgi:GntR family transcriptional regulator of arabinose operon
MSQSELSKHERIRQSVSQDIATGRYAPGQRLPSESALVKAFGASRPTVNRALRDLQLSGVIERRAGSGSYVRKDPSGRGHVFGLLIPELGRTEIFEPICRGMADARPGEQHALLWGRSLADAANIEEQASEACAQLVEKKVAGVFFAPLELTGEKDTINRRIAAVFDGAGIPLVLLDRDLVPYPDRSQYDLVGIDNRRAGYTVTAHLLKAGCRRIVFIGRPRSAPTVDARISGYREAVADARRDSHICRVNPEDVIEVKRILKTIRPDGFVCANDFTAAQLLKTLNALGVAVPDDVRMAGIDDVKYASLLSVPLTTIHQPCGELGAAAISTMLDRLRQPTMPPRDVLLNFTLVVRDSCGAAVRQAAAR